MTKQSKKKKESQEGNCDSSHEKSSAGPLGKGPLLTMQSLLRNMVVLPLVLVAARLLWSHLRSNDVVTFASNERLDGPLWQEVGCSKDYLAEEFHECKPRKCGRVVMDNLVSRDDAEHLLRLAKRGLAHGGSNGGASILDLHTGALSMGDKFINIYKIAENDESLFTDEDFRIYGKVKGQIHSAIAEQFQVPVERLYLTQPTFFSRMDTKAAQTVHDQYWHVHVDKETYGSFHYTSLLYLTTYQQDFSGGRFIFVDGKHNTTVEPRLGRVSFFTSGSENPHFVEQLKEGVRYAITVSFTCDPKKAIPDPKMK